MSFQIFGLHSGLMGGDEIKRIGEAFIKDLVKRTGHLMTWVETPDQFQPDAIPLVFIQTGGTEGQFLKHISKMPHPVYLLTHGAMNSLAASIEILTYLQNQGIHGEIIHGDDDYVTNRLINIEKIHTARRKLANAKLGVIGKPSDWLIASEVSKTLAKEKFGCEIIDIPIQDLIKLSEDDYEFDEPLVEELRQKSFSGVELQKALNIYGALCTLVNQYQLSGLTLRCFDLLETLESTGCIGLALLNARRIPSSCEGDVPALITMMILQYLLGEPGFMVNPSRIDVNRNTMVVAHCTLPLTMGDKYVLETHFESGIGVAVDGQLPKQRAMMFKISANLERYFLSEIQILDNLSENNLCRTQIEIALEEDVQYFLNAPCGNHHIISLNTDTVLLNDFMRRLK